MKVLTRLKQWAGRLKRDVLSVWIAARDPRTPRLAKFVALCVAAYAFSPIDLIPDFIPVLGYLDDLILLPVGIAVVIKLIPPPLMIEFKAAATLINESPVSYTTAFVVAVLWASAALFLYYKFFV